MRASASGYSLHRGHGAPAPAGRLFVLTTRATHWFIERGFTEVGADQLPAKKQALYNLQRNSKVLTRSVKGSAIARFEALAVTLCNWLSE